jgi:hypothetical protein
MVISIVFFVAALLEAFLICRPVSASWNPNANGSCGNEVVAYVVLEACGLFIDVITMLVPLYWIWGLQLKMHAKIKLLILFSMGGL